MKLQVTGERPVDAIDVTGGQQPTVIDVTAGTVTSVNGHTGAVTIDVLDWANATSAPYAAVGDGIADDTSALQAAVNAAAAARSVLYLPRGTYLVSAPITIPAVQGMAIIGAGWGTTVKLKAGSNCYAFQMTGADTRILMRDLTVDGNCSQQGTAGTSGGFNGSGAVACRFDNIHFVACRDDALYLGGQTGGAFGHNNRVIGCLFDQSMTSTGPGRGIHMDSNDENQVIGCDFEYLGGSGGSGATAASMIFDQCGTQFISDCNFVNGGNNAIGVRVQDAKSTKITGCNFDGLAGTAIFLAAQRCIVTSNTIFSVGHAGTAGQASGIHLEYATADNVITDNVITSDPTNGVSRGAIREASDGGSGGNNISNNTIVTSGTWSYAALDLSGTGSQVLGNIGGGAAGNQTIFVNVKSPAYKAKGDGATDDTSAIQAAITALGSQGGTVFLPPGNYLLNGANPLNLNAPITLLGAGHGATTIRIGASFTGSSAVTVASDDCMIQGLQIRGASTTTTSNPACHGVTATGVQEFRAFNATFQYINGYAVRLLGTAGTTLHGTQIDMIKIQSCAGGIHIKSDPAATAANVQLSNIFTRFLGVNSGANANLDGIRIEDSWDVLCQNIMPWMQATLGGTGAAFRVVGNCAAIFVQNLDALGPQTGAANVIVESGANGDPQNVQIAGGVIQQGIIGLLVAGASNQVRVRNVRILNNQTHNVSVTSAGYGIYLDECLISQGGAGATGTNYDVSWSGSAEGFITDCRFGSAVVSTGTAGVQGIINIAASTVVRVLNANFTGSGSASTNWYPTTQPQLASRVDGTNFEMFGNIDFRFAAGQRHSWRPSASTNHVAAINVAGSDTNDRLRLYPDRVEIGPGSSARDTTWGRQGTAQIGTADSDVIIGLAGKTLRVKEGTNAKAGTATLNGTTAVTVSTTAVTSTSRIYLGFVTPAGTPGAPYVSAKTVGTSFQVKSVAGDTSLIAWWIIEAA